MSSENLLADISVRTIKMADIELWVVDESDLGSQETVWHELRSMGVSPTFQFSVDADSTGVVISRRDLLVGYPRFVELFRKVARRHARKGHGGFQ